MQNKKLATIEAFSTSITSAKSVAVCTPGATRNARVISSLAPEGACSRRIPHRRSTELIGIDRSSDVFASLNHACHSGLAPNRHLTVDWAKVGVEDGILATGKFVKQMRDCFGRHRMLGDPTIAYIWVREYGPIVGEHVHILAHVPVGFSHIFAKRKAGWLKNCGAQRKRGGSKTQVISGAATRGPSAVPNPQLYAPNLERVRDYILKHCSHEVQRKFGIRSNGPCLIAGKRVSISQNLHRASRARCELCSGLQ